MSSSREYVQLKIHVIFLFKEKKICQKRKRLEETSRERTKEVKFPRFNLGPVHSFSLMIPSNNGWESKNST